MRILMNKRFTIISFTLCITACLGDFLITYFLGASYPGYSHLSDTLSKMGSLISPVSKLMSTWWIILGSMFVVFGITFWKSFVNANNYIKLAAWLFVFYGIGEGICSGLFPVNYNESGLDLISWLHIILSGIGVLSIFILPFVLQKIFTKEYFPVFYLYSYIFVTLGVIFLSLFSIAKSIDDPTNFFVHLKGLWQRILTINLYGYFIYIVIIMVRQSSNKRI